MYPSRLNNLCTNKYSSTILVHTIKISVETKWIAYRLIPWVLAWPSLKGFDYIWYATRFLSSYYHAMVLWRQMASYNFVITDSGNDLLPGGIKQLPDPMLINNRRGIVAFSWWQLFKISKYLSLIWVWYQLIQHYNHVSQSTILQKIFSIFILDMSLKIGNLRLQPNLSGTNELSFDFVSSCQPLARLIPHLHYGDVIMGAIASQITSITIVYSTFYSDADQRKHQSSTSLAFVRGIHRGPVNSPHKWPVTQEMLPFDDVIIQTWFGWPERKGSAWVVKDSHRLSWR